MGEQKNRWSWEVPGFQPRKSFELLEDDDDIKNGSLLRRYSVSTASALPAARSSQLLVASNKQNLASKVDKIKDKVKRAKEDYLELRQEASDLQEYSNAKLDRVTRYLGVLADKTRKLDQAALETEARISPLIIEKKRLYNDLLTAKGNIRMCCRTRPLFEDEDSSVVEFPDDITIRVNTGDTLGYQVSSPSAKGLVNQTASRNVQSKGNPIDVLALPPPAEKTNSTVALVKSGTDKVKMTAAGEYLTAALMECDPEQYDGLAALADGANKLLMLVLAAVIKAGASREHEILAEIRDAVFSFIRKMEPKRVMGTMLVSRVRILYIRSLLARSPELQSIKVTPVERFLEKDTGRSRSSSRSSSPRRSPVRYDSSTRNALIEEHTHGFKVNIKQEKKSKFSSIVLKLRGIDQETWRQHVTGGKLREITEEAKSFAIGNKGLAALFVHTPAGELQRQIKAWLAENFEFLSVTGGDGMSGTAGQLELLSTAIMDGWMAGLGAALPPNTDALGQLLSEYSKRVYTSQLQHLKDIAGTLATEEAEETAQVAKLRSTLESVDHKRRKILQQLRSDTTLLRVEEGGSPIRNPSTASEDARLTSLISLDGMVKQIKDIMRLAAVSSLTKSKKKAMLESLDELSERMPSLLDIDHPCAQRQISDARSAVECIPEQDDRLQEESRAPQPSGDWGRTAETDVNQWNVLQFNTGSTTPFIIKCGANSHSELVIKTDARVQEPKGGEIIRVVPRPTVLANMSLEDMKQVFNQLPEALSLLALARTADGTRARYSRLYRTLAMKVPSLRDLVSELEKGGVLKDVRS